MAYAESDDGVTWRKPVLGLKEFDGSKANNLVIVLPDGCPNGDGIFKDPSATPARKRRSAGPSPASRWRTATRSRATV